MADSKDRRILYLYLDESGNFDFSEHGTDYFIMTCVAMERPFDCAKSLLSYKYDCIEEGACIEGFHACEDTNLVRENVLDRIEGNCRGYSAFAARIDKKALPEDDRSADAVYSMVFKWVVSEVFLHLDGADFEKVIVVTDSIPKEARRKQVEKPLKAFMKQRFQAAGVEYELMHHRSCSDPNLQVADYVCWAVQRNLAHGKDWPYSRIEPMMKAAEDVKPAE